MDLLASCRWGTSGLATEPWPLGDPRLLFAASCQFAGQNERFQGALELGKLSTDVPSFSLQCSEQVGRNEGSPSSLPVTAGMAPLSQGAWDTHPQQPHRVLWRHCICQLSKGNAARLLLCKNCSLANFLHNSCGEEIGRVTYEVDETPACCSSPSQDLPCVPLLTMPSCVNLPTASLPAAKGVNGISCQQEQLSLYV